MFIPVKNTKQQYLKLEYQMSLWGSISYERLPRMWIETNGQRSRSGRVLRPKTFKNVSRKGQVCKAMTFTEGGKVWKSHHLRLKRELSLILKGDGKQPQEGQHTDYRAAGVCSAEARGLFLIRRGQAPSVSCRPVCIS